MKLIERKVVELELSLKKREAQLKELQAAESLTPRLQIGAAGVQKLTEELEAANEQMAALQAQLARHDGTQANVVQVC